MYQQYMHMLYLWTNALQCRRFQSCIFFLLLCLCYILALGLYKFMIMNFVSIGCIRNNIKLHDLALWNWLLFSYICYLNTLQYRNEFLLVELCILEAERMLVLFVLT